MDFVLLLIAIVYGAFRMTGSMEDAETWKPR